MRILDLLIYFFKQFKVARSIHITLRRIIGKLHISLYKSYQPRIDPIAGFVNALISLQNNTHRYLEIGVGRGELFREVSTAHKVGVDGELNSWKPAKSFLLGSSALDFCSGPKFDIALVDLRALNPLKVTQALVLLKKCIHRDGLVVIVDSIPYSLKNHLYSRVVGPNLFASTPDGLFESSKNLTRIWDTQRIFITFLENHFEKLNPITLVDLDRAVTIVSLQEIDFDSLEFLLPHSNVHSFFTGSKYKVFHPLTLTDYFKLIRSNN